MAILSFFGESLMEPAPVDPDGADLEMDVSDDNIETQRIPTVDKLSENDLRFIQELEFVQMLSNPQYLQFLAQQGYFKQETFINYLSYLKYWQTQPYAKYVVYPYSLQMLDFLQENEFRDQLANMDYSLVLHSKQYKHWQLNLKKHGILDSTKDNK